MYFTRKVKTKKNILNIDINMSCSEYIYGLSVAKANAMIQNKTLKLFFLICADTYGKYIDKKNKKKYLLSDAASVSILEKSTKKKFDNFLFNSDGKNSDKIIFKSNSKQKLSFQVKGSSVYTFALQKIPFLVKKFLKNSNKVISNYKKIFFHQASDIVLKNLQRKIVDKSKIYIDIKNIGNTISSSIQISVKNALNKKIIKKNYDIILCGLSTGLTWAIVSAKV
jgi:3-oxoacyl-[acyl-carrier-protein] synthase-3